MRWTRAAVVLFLLGATVGPALDAIHTHTGTIAYTEFWVFRMAWWVPALFAAAGVAVGLPRPLLERRLQGRIDRPSGLATGASNALFVLAYALSGTLPGGNVVRAGTLGAIFAASFVLFDRTRLGFALALGAAVGGCVVESVLVNAGAFAHLQPDIAGIPLWLPCLYAAAQVAIGNVGRWLVVPPEE